MFQRLQEDIGVYMRRDPAAHSKLEVLLCAPGFHAILCYRLAHKLHRHGWKLLARVISHLARFLTGVEIHPAARIGRHFFIDHGMGVVIGETAYIGNDVSIYHGVTLGGVSPLDATKGALRHPQVGDGVIIGSGAQLLGPIEVGDYARIGSNAVVVNDVEAGATMVGIPAKPVRQRASQADVAFEAYAVSKGNVSDPVQAKLDALAEEVQRLQKRLRQLEDDADNCIETADSWEKK